MNAPIAYPHETSPAPGVAVTLVPGVEWLCMPLPFALNHINLWLLADGDGYAAVDTGFAQDPIKDAWKSALTERLLTRVIVTHCHPDHLGLAAWLEQETGAGLWIAQGEYLAAHMMVEQVAGYRISAMVEFFRRHGLDAARMDGLVQRGNGYKRGVPEIPATYRRLFPDQRLRIGEHEWRTIVGHGHAPEHMSLYCAELGVLISGDMLLPRISTNISVMASTPLADPLGLFLASIDEYLALPVDTLVLPSHGRPFRGLHARVEQLHAHHAQRCALLLDACRGTPKSAADLIPVLFDREIPDPHQTMFAMGESIAHLNYLEHAGKLQRIEETGLIRFVSQP
ncbi:MBL fold metallo-hydrolase [Sulfuritalea sp.]|uniref:MBL fold metallo-hydrolase n=1 Tax=Sulfuritalea sp. TaxID=2480090 RepID=UPI001AC2E31F|nr:MBL fold metallo-hydrolase [Sulfuritalea sp.]MBN8475147.1 MBL fold metallo-hydrolase [Sulfuritalea sp.]